MKTKFKAGDFLVVKIDEIKENHIHAYYEDYVNGRVEGEIEHFVFHAYDYQDIIKYCKVGDILPVKYEPSDKFPFHIKDIIIEHFLSLVDECHNKTLLARYYSPNKRGNEGFFITENGIAVYTWEKGDECSSPGILNDGDYVDLQITTPILDVQQSGMYANAILIRSRKNIEDDDTFLDKAYGKFYSFSLTKSMSQLDAYSSDFAFKFELISANEDAKRYVVKDKTGKYKNLAVLSDSGDEVISFQLNYTSILISSCTTPIVYTVNKYGTGDKGFDREVLMETDYTNEKGRKTHGLLIYDFDNNYSYIDGYDHGLARVKKNGKYGIINTEGTEVVDTIYDNIWNFYKKNTQTTRAEINGKIVEIHLSELPGYQSNDKDSFDDQEALLNSVTLENFKKFAKSTTINYSGINFEVGRNNAGKSTIIKAIILLLHNISRLGKKKQGKMSFSFRPERDTYFENSNFENFVTNTNLSSPISLSVSIGNCTFSYIISKGHNEGEGNIDKLEILHHDTGVKFIYCGSESWEQAISGDGTILSKKSVTSKDDTISWIDDLEKLYENEYIVTKAIADVRISCKAGTNVEHIPALSPSISRYINEVNEESLYNALELLEKENEGYEESWTVLKQFENRWLGRMDIGKEIVIEKEHNADAIKIIDSDGKMEYLCDMGSGSIHFVTLLLHIESLLWQYRDKMSLLPILLVEEPEQNFHPMLQSRLADFFWDVRRVHKLIYNATHHDSKANGFLSGLRLIIETHSEYMIRRSQILVRDFCELLGALDECPFKTYYLSGKDAPEEMPYNSQGKFEKGFGEGFFDEATMLSIQIM